MSPKRNKLIFWIITLLTPFLIFVLLEMSFRLGGYNAESQKLFVDFPVNDHYLVANPNFVSRYFSTFEPQIALQPFKKEKTDSTFRIFVLGGSSAQGFPFNFYYSFATQLEQKLILNTQDAHIEVINLGMTAVNSFVIRDISYRLQEYEPDAIIIYAGHNEYYGSFGVASTQNNVVNSVRTKRLILWLKNFVLYQFIEDLISDDNDSDDAQRTFMARVVGESIIKYDSKMFDAGVSQFKENIEDIIREFQENNIPVFIGTVASNLKDQSPLSDSEEAIQLYESAALSLQNEKVEEAKVYYEKAKDRDEMRFRAPEKINETIKMLSKKDGIYLIDIKRILNELSESGIADNSLFIDHLHPTEIGHYFMADAYFNEIHKIGLMDEFYNENSFDTPFSISNFENAYSTTPILRLKTGYPFIRSLTVNQELALFEDGYRSILNKSFADSMGAESWRYNNVVAFDLKKVINHSKHLDDSMAVATHYYELLHWLSFNDDLLTEAVDYLLNNSKMDTYVVNMISKGLNNGMKDPYLMNMLAATYIINDEIEKAGYWLRKSEKINPNSKNLLYNFSRFHILRGDTNNAHIYYKRFLEQHSNQQKN